MQRWNALILFSLGATLFWLAEFAFQYWRLIPGELGGSFVRSFALAGATFFGFALFSSALFKWIPRWAKFWRYRRYLGVAGFVFIAFHVWSVYHFLFDYDIASIYYSLNPIDNPLIFGSIAFPIFFIIAATSTDWAVKKLTPKIWKFIHRFVYVAYWASVFHFILINPQLLQNTAGYLLLLITGLALFGQFYWFVRTIWKRPKLLALLVGLTIITLYLVTAYLAYQKKL